MSEDVVIAIKSVVVAPGRAEVTQVSSAGVVPIPIRDAGKFDALAERLEARLGVRALVIPDGTPEPGDGTLVVCRPDVLYDLDTRGAMCAWVVAIDLDRTEIVRMAERLSLAAAVEAEDYARWIEGVAAAPAVYGRKDVAADIGAAASVHPLHSGPRYARLTRDGGDLPGLLGDYLAAYERRFLRP